MGSQRSHLLIPVVVFVIQVSPSNLPFLASTIVRKNRCHHLRSICVKPEDVDPFSDEPQPEIAVVRTGEDLDWEVVESFLRDSLPQEIDTAGKFEVHQFPNGAANLTYLVSFGATDSF